MVWLGVLVLVAEFAIPAFVCALAGRSSHRAIDQLRAPQHRPAASAPPSGRGAAPTSAGADASPRPAPAEHHMCAS